MALNVAEANAVGTVVAVLLDLLGADETALAQARRDAYRRALQPAELLTEAAYRRLGAGPRGHDVGTAWSRLWPTGEQTAGAGRPGLRLDEWCPACHAAPCQPCDPYSRLCSGGGEAS